MPLNLKNHAFSRISFLRIWKFNSLLHLILASLSSIFRRNKVHLATFSSIKVVNGWEPLDILAKSSVLDTAWKVFVFRVLLVRIFPHFNWIRRDTPYLFVFSPNTGKYGPENLRMRTLFTQWGVWQGSEYASASDVSPIIQKWTK